MRLLALEGLLLALGAALLAFVVIALIQPIVQGALFPTDRGHSRCSTFEYLRHRGVHRHHLSTGVRRARGQAGRRDVSEMPTAENRDGESRSPLRSGLTIVQAMLSVVLDLSRMTRTSF
jgi:hypothetical protein